MTLYILRRLIFVFRNEYLHGLFELCFCLLFPRKDARLKGIFESMDRLGDILTTGFPPSPLFSAVANLPL